MRFKIGVKSRLMRGLKSNAIGVKSRLMRGLKSRLGLNPGLCEGLNQDWG